MRNIWELICLRHEHRPSQVFLIDQQKELMWKSWQTLVAALCRLLYTILKTNLLLNCLGEGGWNEKTSPQDCIMGKLDGSVIVFLCKIFVSCNSWCITASIKLFYFKPRTSSTPNAAIISLSDRMFHVQEISTQITALRETWDEMLQKVHCQCSLQKHEVFAKVSF